MEVMFRSPVMKRLRMKSRQEKNELKVFRAGKEDKLIMKGRKRSIRLRRKGR